MQQQYSIDSIDMNQYRQQQSLLTTGRALVNMTGSLSGQIQGKLTNTQKIENTQQNTQDKLQKQPQPQQQQQIPIQTGIQNENIQNNVLQLAPNIQNNNSRTNIHHIFSITIDLSVVLYFLFKLIIQQDLSYFGKIWLIYYFFHICAFGIKKQISRPLIMAITIWFTFVYVKEGLESVNWQERIFVLFYFADMIPFLTKILGGICVFCCTCTCAVCCICICISAVIKEACDKRVQKARTVKVREDLCNKNLDQIAQRQCPICLETGNIMNNQQCHHSFHPKCLSAWLNDHKTCPICRHQLYS